MRASRFMEAEGLEPQETVPASRKLGAKEAGELVAAARRVVVAKGTKVEDLSVAKEPKAALVERLLGPTGNLRAPCARVGKVLLVGFNEAAWRDVLA